MTSLTSPEDDFKDRCEQFEMLLNVARWVFPGPYTPAAVAGETYNRVIRLIWQIEDELACVTGSLHHHGYNAVESECLRKLRESLPKNHKEAEEMAKRESRIKEAAAFIEKEIK